MILLIFIIATVFSYTAFAVNELPFTGISPIYAIYIFLAQILLGNLLTSIFGFGLIVIVIQRLLKFPTGTKRLQKLGIAGKQAVFVVIIGFLLSSLMVYVIAFLELNAIAVLLKHNLKTLGVIENKTEIMEILSNNGLPAKIYFRHDKEKEGIVTIAQVAAGEERIYSKYILPSIPQYLILSTGKQMPDMMLIDNTLVINQANREEVNSNSTLVTEQIIKTIFPNRVMKPSPNIIFTNRTEYNKFRITDMYQKIQKMDEELNSYINQNEVIREQVNDDELVVNQKEEELNKVYKEREKEYQNCFSKEKSEVKCKQALINWDDQIIQAAKEVSESKKKVSDSKQLIKDQEDSLKVIQAQKSVLKILENNIIQEYGQFVPPDAIYVTKEDMDSKNIADCFETLSHEYLHYASFISDKHTLADSFWEEGLTEYFARKAINRSLNIDTNIGYPAAVKVISQIAKRIPESELADIYFGKDQMKLEDTLDRVYGDNFYRNTRIYFTLIQYTSEPGQILKYANTIMEKIDGNPLTIEDIISD